MKTTITAALLIAFVFIVDAAGQTGRRTSAPARAKTATGRKAPTKSVKLAAPAKTAKPAAAAAPSQAAITTNSGLTYVVTEKNEAGRQLKPGDTVVVHYTGLLTTGAKFDSSLDRNDPISFPLGQGRVIKGWDEGIQKLRVGERATLIIPPTLGYGANGTRDGVIPPNATLIFVVEVVGVK